VSALSSAPKLECWKLRLSVEQSLSEIVFARIVLGLLSRSALLGRMGLMSLVLVTLLCEEIQGRSTWDDLRGGDGCDGDDDAGMARGGGGDGCGAAMGIVITLHCLKIL